MSLDKSKIVVTHEDFFEAATRVELLALLPVRILSCWKCCDSISPILSATIYRPCGSCILPLRTTSVVLGVPDTFPEYIVPTFAKLLFSAGSR